VIHCRGHLGKLRRTTTINNNKPKKLPRGEAIERKFRSSLEGGDQLRFDVAKFLSWWG
jgi:hypothetical protein